MLEIRQADDNDYDAIWPIFHEIVARGDTYPYPPETDKAGAYDIWMAKPLATYVALWDGVIVGTYYIKPNQSGLGSHVCNAGYMVGTQARGRGVARAMCEHSQHEAKKRGFRAMQFNLVVSSNEVAVNLWQKLGFSVVGTVPEAFHHQELGYVEALVMYKSLVDTA